MYFEAPCVLWCVWFLQDSFQTLKKWVKELKEHGPEDIVVAIAGNKTDLADIRFKPSSSFWKWIILSKVSFQNLQPLSLYFSCCMWSFYLKSTWNQNFTLRADQMNQNVHNFIIKQSIPKYKHKSCFYIVEVKDGPRKLFHFSWVYFELFQFSET